MKKRKLTIRRETLSILTRRVSGGLTGVTCYSVNMRCFHTAEATCFGCITTEEQATEAGHTCVACATTVDTVTIGG